MTSYYLSCLLHELIKLNPALWRCGHMQQSRERMSSWRHEHLSPLIMLERSVGDAGSGYSGVLPWHGRTREGGREGIYVYAKTLLYVYFRRLLQHPNQNDLCAECEEIPAPCPWDVTFTSSLVLILFFISRSLDFFFLLIAIVHVNVTCYCESWWRSRVRNVALKEHDGWLCVRRDLRYSELRNQRVHRVK